MIEIIVVPLTPMIPNIDLFGEDISTDSHLDQQIKAKQRLGMLLDMGFRLFDGRGVNDEQGSVLVYILYKPSPPPAPEVETL